MKAQTIFKEMQSAELGTFPYSYGRKGINEKQA